MTNREWGILAFRMMGLWLVANGLIAAAGVPYFWQPAFAETRGVGSALVLLPSWVALGMGAALWFGAERLAERTFPPVELPGADTQRQALLTFALALAIVGVVLICEAVPELLRALSLFVISRRAIETILGPDLERQKLIWNAAAKANTVAATVRLVIGLALVAGPTRLTTMFGRIRSEFRGSLAEDEDAAR